MWSISDFWWQSEQHKADFFQIWPRWLLYVVLDRTCIWYFAMRTQSDVAFHPIFTPLKCDRQLCAEGGGTINTAYCSWCHVFFCTYSSLQVCVMMFQWDEEHLLLISSAAVFKGCSLWFCHMVTLVSTVYLTFELNVSHFTVITLCSPYLGDSLTLGDVLVAHFDSGVAESFQQVSWVQTHEEGDFVCHCNTNIERYLKRSTPRVTG